MLSSSPSTTPSSPPTTLMITPLRMSMRIEEKLKKETSHCSSWQGCHGAPGVTKSARSGDDWCGSGCDAAQEEDEGGCGFRSNRRRLRMEERRGSGSRARRLLLYEISVSSS